MTIVIEPYDEAWPARFRQLGGAIREALGDDALRIDHIGSTSVPGLVAKDIIDVQITVAALDDRHLAGLTGIGATATAITTDHTPPGMSLPDEELRKRLYKLNPPTAANIHIREDGRFNQRYALLCRDYLRSHPDAADAYGEIKQQLARHLPDDVEAYYDVKDPTFDLFMAGARDWAEWTGWAPGPSDA